MSRPSNRRWFREVWSTEPIRDQLFNQRRQRFPFELLASFGVEF